MIMELLEDAWDGVVGAWEYLISFEWVSDIVEVFSTIFENIGQFSVYGVFFGVLGFMVVYLARDYMLDPFLVHMGGLTKLFWMIATYVGTFVAGYLLGMFFENS